MTTATTVNVPDLIDEQKVGSFQIRILVLCALAATLDGFAAQMIGYVAPSRRAGHAPRPRRAHSNFRLGPRRA